jgi:KAP family P-loop domain
MAGWMMSRQMSETTEHGPIDGLPVDLVIAASCRLLLSALPAIDPGSALLLEVACLLGIVSEVGGKQPNSNVPGAILRFIRERPNEKQPTADLLRTAEQMLVLLPTKAAGQELDNLWRSVVSLKKYSNLRGWGSTGISEMEAARELTTRAKSTDTPQIEAFIRRPIDAPLGEAAKNIFKDSVDRKLVDRFQKYMKEGVGADDARASIEEWRWRNLPHPDARLLADLPLQKGEPDRLNIEPYANAIARLIKNPKTTTPLTIAINAPWGAGKSTLARMIQDRVEEIPPSVHSTVSPVTCWFNAWMHDDAPSLASSFAAEVARVANTRRPLWRRIVQPIPSSLLRARDRWKRRLLVPVILLAITLPFAPSLAKWLPAGGTDKDILSQLQGVFVKYPQRAFAVGVIAIIQLFSALLPVLKPLGSFVASPEKAAAAGLMSGVREQLGELIGQATPDGGRFLIFVDDIERCKPPKSIEVLEVANQLLSHPGVVVVLLADLPAVAACANIKYKELAEQYTPTGFATTVNDRDHAKLAYGRAYLQKVIQVQFDMPSHRPKHVQDLVRDLLQGEASVKDQVPAEVQNSGNAGETENAKPPEDEKKPKIRAIESANRGVGWRSVTHDWVQGYAPIQELKEDWARSGGSRSVLIFSTAVSVIPRIITSWVDVNAYPRSADSKSFFPSTVWLTRSRWLSALWTLFFAIFTLFFLMDVSGSRKQFTTFLAMRFGFDVSASFLFLCADVLSGMLLIVVVETWWRSHTQKLLDQKLRAEARRQIEDAAKKDPLADPRAIREQIHGAIGFDFDEALVREEFSFVVADDSDLRREAEMEIINYLPALPRSAKRIINRLRLFILIAVERNMFNGAVSPREIGKWALLCERWPDLADVLSLKPKSIDDLESKAKSKAGEDSFRQHVRNLAPNYAEDAELQKFCAGGARLSGVMEKLIHFES